MASIRCSDCHKLKPDQGFSNGLIQTLNKLKAKNKNNKTFNPINSGYIGCRLCTPQQRTEMKCRVCDQVEGLNRFPNNQRKDPENARCQQCHNKQGLEDEPGAERGDNEGSGSSAESDDSDGEGASTL